MDLKSFINKNEGGEFVKESVSEEVTEIKFEELENEVLDVKIEVPTERIVTEKSELNFVGSFNYVPDPIEYGEGSIYKNVNEGVAYIRKGLLWEELVRDGKPGRDAARVSGSGVGVAEVKSITGMLGIFDSKAELDKVPTTNLKIGTTATLPSGPVTWRGVAGGGWVGDGLVYDGTTLPIPTVFSGDSIIVQNAAVACGKSRLCWNGSAYVPAAGETIASAWGIGDAYLADVTPGNLTQTVIYQGALIPHYMLPGGFKGEIFVQAGASNAAGVSGCWIGFAVATSAPTTPLDTQSYNYPGTWGGTPNANGVGFEQTTAYRQIGVNLARTQIKHANGGNGRYSRNQCNPTDLTAGNARLYVVAKASHVSDRFTVDGIALRSIGGI